MINLSLIISAYCRWRIKQSRKQIFLDILNLCRVSLEAIHHIFNMTRIKLQKFPFHKIGWIFVTGNNSIRLKILPMRYILTLLLRIAENHD